MSDRPRRRVGEIIRRAVVLETVLVSAVIGLALTGVLLERSVSSSERKDQQTLLDLESFQFQVLNAETGFRGFALARKPSFLAPYRQAFPAIAELRPKLLRLVGEDDRPYLDEAFRVIADWRRNFAEPAIQNFRTGTGTNANLRIETAEGKRRIDRIRVLTA